MRYAEGKQKKPLKFEGLLGIALHLVDASPLNHLFCRHQGNCGVQHAVRETPLVVIPARDLDQLT